MLTEAVGQVQAIAQVYGLQVGASGPLRVAQRDAGHRRVGAAHLRAHIRHGVDEAVQWLLPEAESIPIALTSTSC
jgi:hypothetical protein